MQKRTKINAQTDLDLAEENLSLLADLMLAQATECVYEKASEGKFIFLALIDKCSSTVTSMIACQTADYYCLAARYDVLNKDWLKMMKSKAEFYFAIAHFHAPLSCQVKGFSERICRLSLALEHAEQSAALAQSLDGNWLAIVSKINEQISTALNLLLSQSCEAKLDVKLLSALKRPASSMLTTPDMYSIFKPVLSIESALTTSISK